MKDEAEVRALCIYALLMFMNLEKAEVALLLESSLHLARSLQIYSLGEILSH